MNQKYLALGASAVVAVTAFIFFQSQPSQDGTPSAAKTDGTAMVEIAMPEIKGNAALGQNIFESICAACHGTQGVGNAQAGPPLIHKIYEPSHHGDESFQRAVAHGVRAHHWQFGNMPAIDVAHGVRAHHWQFGNMPAIDGLTRGDVAMVIEYIRTIQRANGIK